MSEGLPARLNTSSSLILPTATCRRRQDLLSTFIIGLRSWLCCSRSAPATDESLKLTGLRICKCLISFLGSFSVEEEGQRVCGRGGGGGQEGALPHPSCESHVVECVVELMMLASEAGKESVRIMEMERMIRLDMTTSLGLGHVENLGAAAHHVMPSWAQQLRRPPPVQLDLLPMSRSSHDSVHETSTAEPAPDSSVTDRFSSLLEQTFLSRMDSCNEGSLFCAGNNNADGVAVETYSSGGGRGSSPRDIDMNQLPSTSDGDDEAVVSSPSCSIGIMTSNPSITTDQRDQIKWHVNMQLFDPAELQDMRGTAGGGCDLSSRRGSDDEADGSAATTRKKLRLSKEQSALLEDSFKDHSTLNPKQKNALAKQLNLRPRQVEVWFQNRRARTKLKQTEVDCEVLKRYYENLTEDNRRLKKELQEVRALKQLTPAAAAAASSPAQQLCNNLYRPLQLPAATLTMCPSCENAQSSLIRASFRF